MAAAPDSASQSASVRSLGWMPRSASMSACQRSPASQRLRTAAMSGLMAAASASVSCSYRTGMPAAALVVAAASTGVGWSPASSRVRPAYRAGSANARAAPGDALFGFLLEVIEKSAGRQHVCDALAADRGWPRALLTAASQRFRAGLDRLLRDAKQAGAVRADLRADDLSALACAGAALCSAHRDRARGLRLARLLLDGLRVPAVTKSVQSRDADSRRRHETVERGLRHCEECGIPLRLQATGRPRRYCGAACRQRARRRRGTS